MNNLIIIGARGFGREVYHLATQCGDYQKEFQIKGFLDSKADALESYSGYPPILGAVETYVPQPQDRFVCALGDVKAKKHYLSIIREKGGRFVSLIHPTAIILSNTSIGVGAIILANVFISSEVVIGDYVTIQPFSAIGHDARISDYAHLNAYAFVGGYAQVGEGATLHTGAKVLPHKRIGDWAIVGAGSVVLRNVKAGETVFGVPALSLM